MNANKLTKQLTRACDAYLEWRRTLSVAAHEHATALLRAAAITIANSEWEYGEITDHEHEQRLIAVHRMDMHQLRKEVTS